MRRSGILLVLFTLFVSVCVGDDRLIPYNAKLFIEEMDNDLDGFIRAEIVKRKVPVIVVLDIAQADHVMTGFSSEPRKGSWHEGWLTPEKDKNEGNVTIFRKDEKVLVWASEAGDRSWWWGSLKRGGQRKVAERLVKNLKKVVASRSSRE